ncbi:amidophosphoribosyltransferase-like isoform X2 [Anthonomus grandis grandis]|uniref:amidophosphoribosyltransferase-like isoform X2 n=1 Tax=Anthonomus grandis grandis TaxID=2921223 RepID=UPI002165F7BD|nr:amidophosphoribosyltransferase-like isoform X2 [Anthonomus grandis grandis]
MENQVPHFPEKHKNRGQVDSGLTHECGVFGAIGNESWESNTEIAQIVMIGLQALQHRGQESTGIVTSEGHNEFNVQKGMGLVKNVFTNDNISHLTGTMGIGHTRYSTSAKSTAVNAQPFVVHSMHGSLAVAHNGELVNAAALRKQVLDRGIGLSTHSDSELITQALCLIPPEGEVGGPDWPARIRHLMQLAPLSYSLVIMLKDRIYAVRDPYGNRPLCLGKILASTNEMVNGYSEDLVNKIIESEKPADGWVVASESCAFMKITRYSREVRPGEIVELTRNGPRTIDIIPTPEGRHLAFCIFEYVYFARPTSIFEGQEVYNARVHCGRQLALEHPVEADIVGSVPESGNAAAHGYSLESKIPQGELLAKNSYVGRTFIQPSNRLRQMNVALKFSPILANVKGKRVILIDDSIVRGNTVGPIIKLLRKAGAKEVHIRIASPPLKFPCYMGINIPTREELIANAKDFEDIALKVGADSLHYLSVQGLVRAVQKDIKVDGREIGHCTACLTGDYPGGLPVEYEW